MSASDPRTEIVALLSSAFDLAEANAGDLQQTMTAVSHACRMGLDAITGTVPGGPVLASFGEPGKRRQKWIIHYQDAEVGSVVYDSALYGDAEAELLARDHYARASVQWNCTLLKIATLDASDEERHRVRAEALERSLRNLRGLVVDDCHPDAPAALAEADAVLGAGVGS